MLHAKEKKNHCHSVTDIVTIFTVEGQTQLFSKKNSDSLKIVIVQK
jgi:hypothetical protein